MVDATHAHLRLESPFAWLPQQMQFPLCLLLIVAVLAFGCYLGKQGAPLDRLLPHGVLDIAAPWSTERAQAINQALGDSGIAAARRHTALDFIFLVLYPLALSLACALLAAALPGKPGAIGMMVAWAVLCAAPLDAVENLAMLQLLAGSTSAPWPQLATVCAAVKFTLVLGALAFAVVGALRRLVLFFV